MWLEGELEEEPLSQAVQSERVSILKREGKRDFLTKEVKGGGDASLPDSIPSINRIQRGGKKKKSIL